MSSRIRSTRLTLVALLACAALAACGEEENQPAVPAGGALSVTLTDFAIEPAEVRMEAAGVVRASVVNRGKSPHALAIETADGVVKTKTLAAGESGEVEAELEDGTYAWFCPVGDHRAKGMEGAVTVGDAARTDGSSEREPRGGYDY